MHLLLVNTSAKFKPKLVIIPPTKKELALRWEKKREAIKNLENKLDSLKRYIYSCLTSEECSEKDELTALIVRIMLKTCERVGNPDSAKAGHFGVTQFKPKHVTIIGRCIHFDYIGKSGVSHEKSFSDETSAILLKKLKKRNSKYLFTTKDGFQIMHDRVNRFLSKFDVTSKDIRGYNANEYMMYELKCVGRIKDKKERPKVFNQLLRKVAKKVGHGAATLRSHYLLPEIEQKFYAIGKF